jgi:hypothetical protein
MRAITVKTQQGKCISIREGRADIPDTKREKEELRIP